MAMAKQAYGKRRFSWVKVLAIIAAILIGAGWFFRAPIVGHSELATAHAARHVCSCMHIGGQSEGVCEGNFALDSIPVFVNADAEGRSVTASVPLAASNTATYQEGFGCVLEPWDG